MKPLHQVLPKLEAAVAKRREAPLLRQMDAGELRDLVYGIVEGYHRQRTDPEAVYADWAKLAAARALEVRGEQLEGADLRAEILEALLPIAAASMAGIGTQIRTQILRYGTEQQQYITHELLRGIELGGTRKQIDGDDGVRTIAGRTWWIVTLVGAPVVAEVPDVRWAILDHCGSLDAESRGEERITVTLTTADELSLQVSDKIVGSMLQFLGERLQKAAEGGQTSVEEQRRRLQAALAALKSE